MAHEISNEVIMKWRKFYSKKTFCKFHLQIQKTGEKPHKRTHEFFNLKFHPNFYVRGIF